MSEVKLNKQQELAVNSDSRTILCLAAAGCGKTKTLVTRIATSVQKGVNPRRILALTFTNAAAAEMKERYKHFPGIDLSKGTPEFRTFHSFCYSLIIKDKTVRNRIGYSQIPKLCDEKKLKQIKEEIKLQLNCTLTDEQLENDVTLSKKDQATKDLYKKALIKKIKSENVITFDIMCYNVCELFSRDDECIKQYKEWYTYLYVDEMQDCDPKQFKFVASFPETTNFFMVGDILQAIYGFRGCSNEFIKQLTHAPGWQVIKMGDNYRSTVQICDFANKFSTYSKDEFRVEMTGHREGPQVKVIFGSHSSYHQPVDQDHLYILVDALKSNQTESAILCRTNRECECVKSTLRSYGIEFNSDHKEGDTLNYLNGALDNEYLVDWLSSFLDSAEYGDYIRLSAIRGSADLNWFYGLYGKHPKIQKIGDKVKRIRQIASSDFSVAEKAEQITKFLKVKTRCEFDETVHISNRELVEQIRDQIEYDAENKIYVGTIHSSKGLEYDAVYVMGVDDRMFQLGSEDMNNLYYVACTRAKNYLTVFRR